ncbi:type II toxin-antitoxin system VapC family toxin [Turneriella parva]|uniref:Ribonuclease VapC n=1 Tax=Turneriella parva (strain ATCC BAA-1111 / DSM 21527 / NCTC 11395 / H) TaxID=869212 RepID=I4B3T7_TURPD|nr:PIN domain-containing protein [Turneriella parva]AFM11944.1 PilT protein domain protein [Turneriella parva DSM 21527]
MALLVDSSVYIDWMRRRHEFVRDIAQFRQHTPIYICGIIQAEVARGILQESLREKFLEFSNLLDLIDVDAAIWLETARLAWQLDRKGLTLPLTDLAIACCAKRVGAEIVTLDTDFQKIPGLKIRKNL